METGTLTLVLTLPDVVQFLSFLKNVQIENEVYSNGRAQAIKDIATLLEYGDNEIDFKDRFAKRYSNWLKRPQASVDWIQGYTSIGELFVPSIRELEGINGI